MIRKRREGLAKEVDYDGGRETRGDCGPIGFGVGMEGLAGLHCLVEFGAPGFCVGKSEGDVDDEVREWVADLSGVVVVFMDPVGCFDD